MRSLAALGPLLAAFALNAAAAPFVARLGAERVVLDAPPGFSDSLGLASPRLQELAESQTSASNRVLLFAIADADLRRFMGGDRPEFKRYMIAAIPARLEQDRLSAGEFGTFASASLREMGAPPATTDYLKHIDARPRGRPQLLAELRNDPFVVSVLLGARLAQDGEREQPQYLFSTTTLLLVRGKALTLSVYTSHDGPADLEWIRSMTLRWVDELLRLNRGP